MALEFSDKRLKRVLETKQGKTYTVFGVTVLTVILLFLLAVRPAWVSITKRLSENEQKREYIQQADQKINLLNAMLQQYNVNINSINLLDIYLPEEPNQSFVINNFILIASERNLKITALTIDKAEEIDSISVPVTDPSIISQNTFTLSLEGTLFNLETFIIDLEKSGKIVNIQSIDYTISNNTGGLNDQWTMTIRGIFYFWDINSIKNNV